MSPKNTKKQSIRNRRKKLGAGVEISEGPIDEKNHIFSSKEELSLHVGDMERKKEYIRQQKSYYENKYQENLSKKLNQKQQDEQAMHARKEREWQAKQRDDDREAQEWDAAVDERNNTIMNMIYFIKYVFENLIKFLRWILSSIVVLFYAMKALWDSIFNGRGFLSIVKPPNTAIWAFIFFVIFLALFIWGIVELVKVMTRKDEGAGGTPQANDEKCSSIMSNGIVINIENANKATTQALSTVIEQTDAVFKPLFAQIKEIPQKKFMEVFKNPAAYMGDNMKYLYDVIMRTEPIASMLLYAKYASNAFLFNAQSITGGSVFKYFNNTTERETIPDGRSDNINNIDSSIFPASLMRAKNIQTMNTVVNLSKPMDIKWALPETQYDGLDVSKLPPSILNAKGDNELSLNDKKKIVIPWINKGNNYVLSCSDAYFEDNINEKANILKDIDDNTCDYNQDSLPQVFTEEKERYTYTSDLSTFL